MECGAEAAIINFEDDQLNEENGDHDEADFDDDPDFDEAFLNSIDYGEDEDEFVNSVVLSGVDDNCFYGLDGYRWR